MSDQPESPLPSRAGLFDRLKDSSTLLYGFVVKLVAIFPILLIAALLARDVTQRTMSIQPISVPKTMSDEGYTPAVTAQKLLDDINAIYADAQTKVGKEDVALQQERPDFVVPGVGLSVDTVANAILGFFNGGGHQNITGEFTSSRGELRLQLRINDETILAGRGITGSPDALLRTAARKVLSRTAPYIVAAETYGTNPLAAYDEATAIIDKRPRTDEEVAYAYNLRGLILAARKKYEYAEAQYVEAFLLDPGLPTPHYNLGNLLRDEGSFDEALIQYGEALRLDPRDAETHVALAELFIDRREYDHAFGELREALRLDPLDKYAHNALGDFLSNDPAPGDPSHPRQRVAEAKEEYLTAIRLDPVYSDPHAGLGNLLKAEHNVAGAESEFKTCVRLDPARAAVQDTLAWFLRQENKVDEAIVHYKAAISADRDDAYAYNGLADALILKKDYKSAIKYARLATRKSPKGPYPHFYMAIALVNEVETDPRERAAKACREFRLAHQLAPSDPHLYPASLGPKLDSLLGLGHHCLTK